jgi:hypothetical protein
LILSQAKRFSTALDNARAGWFKRGVIAKKVFPKLVRQAANQASFQRAADGTRSVPATFS